jgi:GntR family transcriptional regulator
MEAENAVSAFSLIITPVDADSPVPLYYQIENDLRRMIQSGRIPPGSTIPAEMELCRIYGVGRHTMRMALSRLAADDMITRRAGKGTVVNPQTDRMKFYLDRSFTQQMADMGREAHSIVLEMVAGTVDESCPPALRSKLGAACLRLVRLRFGDNEPVGLQSTTILTAQCPDLINQDFQQNSLYDILSRHYQLSITEIRHTISAASASKIQADLLNVSAGDPLLVVSTTAYLDNRQLVENTISYYRADRYEYSTTHVYTP